MSYADCEAVTLATLDYFSDVDTIAGYGLRTLQSCQAPYLSTTIRMQRVGDSDVTTTLAWCDAEVGRSAV